MRRTLLKTDAASGMTYRERRERRAERLRGWADGRRAKAASGFARADAISSMIPLGQPILVGHHSEGRHRRDLDRIDSGMRQGIDSQRMALRHDSRADNIEAALDRSIYSDDADAIEKLAARIRGLEAERARIKAYNASCRKGQPDMSLLDDAQRASLESCLKYAAYSCGKQGEMPSYTAANLSGSISKQRQRLEMRRRAAAVSS